MESKSRQEGILYNYVNFSTEGRGLISIKYSSELSDKELAAFLREAADMLSAPNMVDHDVF